MPVTITEDRNTITISSSSIKDESLVIDRKSFEITKAAAAAAPGGVGGGAGSVYAALLGAVRLLSGHYLVLVKSSQSCAGENGEFFHHVDPKSGVNVRHQVYQCTQIELKPVLADQQLQTLPSMEQQSDERQYMELLSDELLNKEPKSFYYSETYDLSCSLQEYFTRHTQRQQQAQESGRPQWDSIDDQFVWNQHLANPFIEAGAAQWCTPVIRGIVSLNRCVLRGENFDFHIVSRLSWKRVGTRYNTRGIDRNGNAANFVETEQIIRYKDDMKSLLQIRASIPLLWSQKPNLQYKPPTVLRENSEAAFRSHMDVLVERYGRITGINLVNLHGSEKVLADEYERQVKMYNSTHASDPSAVRLISFDFHKETKGMRYDNLKKLVDMCSDDMRDFGYFWIDLKSGEVRRKQLGVLRVNCIDCLDRTNVMESVFGRLFLVRKLREIGLLRDAEDISTHPELEYLFKNVWADNGDQLSKLYSGTGALKADYTRTGKRTLVGNWYDLVNSITRYYLNNFRDGRRQDACNLMLGKYEVDSKAVSPFQQQNNLQVVYSALKIGFFAGLMMVAANVSQLPIDPDLKSRFISVLLWIIFTYMIYTILIKNGRVIVNNPVLEYDYAHEKSTAVAQQVVTKKGPKRD